MTLRSGAFGLARLAGGLWGRRRARDGHTHGTLEPAGARFRLAAWSIATRLFLSSAFWSSVILLVAGLILSAINRKSAEADFDARLSVYLKALVADLVSPGEENRANPGQLGEIMFDFPLSGWYWQITRLDRDDPNDTKTSRSLFAERLPRLEDLGVAGGPGGSRRGYTIGPDDRRLRLVEQTIDNGAAGRFLVQVAGSPEEVEIDIAEFNVALLLVFTLLALALVGSSALQVRFGLRPLRALGGEVATIRRGDGERIVGRYPPDIAPLASELNLLMASNREIVDRARTHVGNLAHALKTPLSVIVNEAAARGTQPDPDAFAEKVREQARVMNQQVAHYLDRARAAARSSVIGVLTEVPPVMEGLVRTFEKIYRDRAVSFTVSVPPGVRFRGEKQDFEELVGNLVDNAGKWAATRVAVEVRAVAGAGDQRPSGIEIIVDDDGPGLSEQARQVVLARGRRLDESKPGSGLGLSIVTDLSAVYGGSLALSDSPMGGLRAVLRLPGTRTEFRPNPV